MSTDFEHAAVPTSARHSTWTISAVWAGFVFVPIFINFAFFLSSTMTTWKFILAVTVGGSILALCSFVAGLSAQTTGLSAGLLLEKLFGSSAGRVIAVLPPLCLIGWNAFTLDLVGTSSASFFGEPGLRVWAILFWTIPFATSAVFGFKSLQRLSRVAVPAMAVLLLVLVIRGYQLNVDTSTFPSDPGISTSFPTAVSQIVGLFALGAAVCSPDLQRFGSGKRSPAIVAISTFIIAFPFVLIVGGLAAKELGATSLTAAYEIAGMNLIGYLVFIALSWTTADNDYYSASLGLAVALRMKKTVVVPLLAAVAATIAIVGVSDRLGQWLTSMSIVATPLAGIFIGGLILGHLTSREYEVNPAVPFSAWTAGALVGYLTERASFGLPPLQAIAASCLVYFVVSPLLARQPESVYVDA